MIDGTRKDTVAKNLARRTLLNLLRQEAAYVQSLANENLEMLLSSGFQSVSTKSRADRIAQAGD